MKVQVARGFDLLAPVYDRLARLMIGEGIVHSQSHFLACFGNCKHLLILGGGSGWLLNDLCTSYPDLDIDYIDTSSRMIDKAREKVGDNSRINFIQGTEDDIPNDQYDGVITNFYLDMFTVSLGNVIEKIKDSLVTGAQWVVTDFVNERKSHSIQLWCMYRFFRIITRIEAGHLADWQSQMLLAGFKLTGRKKFSNGFITSNLYHHGSLSYLNLNGIN